MDRIQIMRRVREGWCLGGAVVLLTAQVAVAGSLFSSTFGNGMDEWKIESGKAARISMDGGSLELRSVKEDGQFLQGVVSCRVNGLVPAHDYELRVRFRFEKDFTDTWPWSAVEVWDAASVEKEEAGNKIVGRMIRGQSDSDSTPPGTWREVVVPFTTGKETTVVIRLRNHPKMMDRTHWDDIQVVEVTR